MFKVIGVTFHLYGLMIGLGIFCGFWVAERVKNKFEKQGWKFGELEVWDTLWWVVIPAIVLGRIYHVIGAWDYYSINILLIVMIWDGGTGIIGAIIGGVIGLYIYAKKRRISFINLLDLAAFGLPIGQAIGRWGNYLNKELYGLPTNVIWKIYIPIECRLENVKQYEYFHPLFLYEAIWNLMIFGVLYFILSKKSRKLNSGNYFSVYLISYGIGRLFLEFMRIESWHILRVNIAQLLSIIMILIGFFLVKLRKI